MPYFDTTTVARAIGDLYGTAGHLLKIWLVLKQMGMDPETEVEIDTGNSTDALNRLFGYGHPEGRFFVPFGHTERFRTMKSDASRSIVQTTLTRWAESGSVVTVDPTGYLSIRRTETSTVMVRPGRSYPEGLGFGPNGFARSEGGLVRVPLIPFAIWYYRTTELESPDQVGDELRSRLRSDLHLSVAEEGLLFDLTPPSWPITLQPTSMLGQDLLDVVTANLAEPGEQAVEVHSNEDKYRLQVRSMSTISEGRPAWLAEDPASLLGRRIEGGSKAILLYGPPRTGKTRAALGLLGDGAGRRIQIHDGWGYEELMIGLRPDSDKNWGFVPGPVVTAIREGVSWILLEEINRTDFSRAVGELFSLLEEEYRGEEHALTLPDGSEFYVPETTLLVCTMNTLDRSTEAVDDALFGRMASIEFRPRVEALSEMLDEQGVEAPDLWRQLFGAIQQYHPLGHGFFVGIGNYRSPIEFYQVRIRPVLQKHLEGYRDEDLRAIDDRVDQLFG